MLVTLPVTYTAPPFSAVFSSNLEFEMFALLPSMKNAPPPIVRFSFSP